MASLSIPHGGLILHQGADKGGKAPSQAFRLDLAHDTKNHILRSLRNAEQVRLRFGKKPTLHLGRKSLDLAVHNDSFTSDVYVERTQKDGGLYFSGQLSHRLEVQMAKEALANSDAALTMLENNLKSIQAQKAVNETSFVRNKEEMKQLNKKTANGRKPAPLPPPRQDRFLGSFNKSSSPSPLPGSAFSPRSGPTLSSSLAGKEDLVRLEAIKIPMIHLLAASPITTEAIVQKLRVSKEDADKLLQKFARDSRDAPSKKELKEKSYRDLDIWKFPYSTNEKRQAAINRAIQAFDRMRIDRRDAIWQLLLPVAERGKGKILSKLNFDKPVVGNPNQRTQSQHRSPKDDASESNTRGRLNVKDSQSTPRSQSHDPQQKQKVGGKEVPKKEVNKISKKSPASTKAKASGKFKSAEIIEDSDEEEEAAKAESSRPAVTDTKTQSPKPPPSPLPHKSFHKSKLSTSSFPDQSASPLKPTPRPRTVSSPLKPSASDSSPPTGSTDLDSSSTKASTQSSATSSPPSGNEMPKRKTFSPVISDAKNTPARARSRTENSSSSSTDRKDISRGRSDTRNATSRGRSPVKRKAESDLVDESTPAKRQQLNSSTRDGVARKKEPVRPALDRKASESESISSPEKTETATAEMVENSRRFYKYYDVYKALHEKVTADAHPDDQEIADVWRMHNRLAEMKKDIWDDFEALGRPTKEQLAAACQKKE